MTTLRTRSVLGILCMLTIGLTTAFAESYTESFFDKNFCDEGLTTAFWDTAAGELKLAPFLPEIVAGLPTTPFAIGIAVVGDIAFLAGGTGGLHSIDISDPENPVMLFTHSTEGAAYAVAVSGDFAYVGESIGFEVFDISDPAAPSWVTTVWTVGEVHDLAVAGDCLFGAADDEGLITYDISDPGMPLGMGSYATTDEALGLTLAGDIAYIAGGLGGLVVLDITDPGNPTLVAVLPTGGYASDVALAGDYAYVADAWSGITVVDISDPSLPALLTSVPTADYARAVALDGNTLYAAINILGVERFDISAPDNPQSLGFLFTPGAAFDLVIDGEHAFVADYSGGLTVIGITGKREPRIFDSITSAGTGWRVVADGDYVFLCDHFGLPIFDVTDPTDLQPLGVGESGATNVAIRGDLAYVAEYNSGLCVVDISDPTAPVTIGEYGWPAHIFGIDVAGDIALLAAWEGLTILDVSDPTTPGYLGFLHLGTTYYQQIQIDGDYAYMALHGGGFTVIDISDPANPAAIGHDDTACWDLEVRGDLAYLAGDELGLRILDILDPTAPTLIGELLLPGISGGIDVVGNYAFLATGGTLEIVDVSDPTQPQSLYSIDIGEEGVLSDVTVEGDFAYLAHDILGLISCQVFDRQLESGENFAQSLVLDGADLTIERVRLSSTQNDIFLWEFSADGGLTWTPALLEGDWQSPIVPGGELLWRCHLYSPAPGENPVCSELNIEWRVGEPVLLSLADTPDDEGGTLDLSFRASGLDHAEETINPAGSYNIWRNMRSPRDGDTRVIWEIIGNIPATQSEEYAITLPSHGDSTATELPMTLIKVEVVTPQSPYSYFSEPDSAYSVDNLFPAAPTGFEVVYYPDGNQLAWNPSSAPDCEFYRIYRDTIPGFAPGLETLLDETDDTEWTDLFRDDAAWNDYHYMISTVDDADNESEAIGPQQTTGTEETPPARLALLQNAPNPFNPTTSIFLEVPTGGAELTLVVYDGLGRRLRVLHEGYLNSGRHEMVWNGRDERGRALPSGVYFYRVEGSGQPQTRKMVLLK